MPYENNLTERDLKKMKIGLKDFNIYIPDENAVSEIYRVSKYLKTHGNACQHQSEKTQIRRNLNYDSSQKRRPFDG